MTLERMTKPIDDTQDAGPAERIASAEPSASAERTASAESIAPAVGATPTEGAAPAEDGALPAPLPAVWPATTGLAHGGTGGCLVPNTVPFDRYCLEFIFSIEDGLKVVAGELLYPPMVPHPEQYNRAFLAQSLRLHLARDHRQVMRRSVAPVPEGLTLTMNLYGFEVGEDEALLMTGAQLGRPLERVLLEVPETESLASIVACQAGYWQLKALGHRLALDDLRGCYEDMQRLVALEPDVVKLDKALAPHLETSLLVRSLIGRFLELCRMAGVTVILEGVETLGQLVAARTLGITHIQGWLFHRKEAVEVALRRFQNVSVDGAPAFPQARWHASPRQVRGRINQCVLMEKAMGRLAANGTEEERSAVFGGGKAGAVADWDNDHRVTGAREGRTADTLVVGDALVQEGHRRVETRCLSKAGSPRILARTRNATGKSGVFLLLFGLILSGILPGFLPGFLSGLMPGSWPAVVSGFLPGIAEAAPKDTAGLVYYCPVPVGDPGMDRAIARVAADQLVQVVAASPAESAFCARTWLDRVDVDSAVARRLARVLLRASAHNPEARASLPTGGYVVVYSTDLFLESRPAGAPAEVDHRDRHMARAHEEGHRRAPPRGMLGGWPTARGAVCAGDIPLTSPRVSVPPEGLSREARRLAAAVVAVSCRVRTALLVMVDTDGLVRVAWVDSRSVGDPGALGDPRAGGL